MEERGAPGRPARFFDAHCDTVMKVLDHDADFITGERSHHISLPALREAGFGTQVFAVYVLSKEYPGCEAQRANAMIDAIEEMVSGSGGAMAFARTRAELKANEESGKISAILGLEGADPLEGKADNLTAFVDRGVRDLIFAWQDNPFSGTAFGTNTPLSKEGERLLGLSEELGVMVDVSHLSDTAFDDVCRMATRPFIASHSDCRSLCGSPRNLTDDMIRRLADRGGVMGINLSPGFLAQSWWDLFVRWRNPDLSDAERAALNAERESLELPGLDVVVQHIAHAIRVGGEDCIGLGGDLDGIAATPAGLDTVADYVKLPRLLRSAGLNDRQIEKICYGNFARVFEDVLPA